MASKAWVTRRGATVGAASGEELANLGVTVTEQLAGATLVEGSTESLIQLEQRGFRVKVLPEPNLIEIGSYRIDIDAYPPAVPAPLEVPADLTEQWPHHLVQLTGPPVPEWTQAIEQRGVDVVEPVSAYGLFVVGTPAAVASLRDLPFVRWTGPFKPAYRIGASLRGMTGRIRSVTVLVHPPDAAAEVKQALLGLGAELVSESLPDDPAARYARIVADIDADQLAAVAALEPVRSLDFAAPEPGFDGERETQIVAENLDANPAPDTGPVTGYQPWLATLGLSGAGTTVAICDTGVDVNADNNITGHLDLRGRQVAFVDYTGGVVTGDTDGHGTHVAGIAVGNAGTGMTEGPVPGDFFWGQGMAPSAGFVTQNALIGPWPPADFGALTQDSVINGAQVMNNSWWDGGAPGSGYTANARRFDQLVRDPNDATADLDYLVIVFSAGNAGPKASTITPPKEAKNPIVVGNSLTFRPGVGAVDDIRGIANSSSRGPALDGRLLPTVVAPGTNVSSARSSQCTIPPIPGTSDSYVFSSGTSMAAPHVAGVCALLMQWWRNRTGGHNPSPAMLKALLVNGAENLAGGPNGTGGTLGHIPDNHQGWGRVSAENILLQAPASDRGPRIFLDQRVAFTANGQEFLIRVAPVNPAQPLRVTLVWTDAPGAVNASPALTNDLDLEVTEVDTATIYKGNVFANGFSAPGGMFDNRNTVECVYVQSPAGTCEVRVIAGALTGNALPPFDNTLWQDFALVIENAEVPGAAPVSVVPVLDRSGSMVYYDYEALTRTASKQFVDLLSIDDQLGVVSFGDTGDIEYGPGAALAVITGAAVRDAAKAAVDGIGFGGCTFMGDGIVDARDLLTPAAGSRAMVLFSDGYDNKGCDLANPAKPSALDAVATLPPELPVYTCAMGPAADQALLAQLATATGGRYLYMPSIDDLFLVYNYIRGQVTDDGVIANELATASGSRTAAFVDALATEVLFTVAWGAPALRWVASTPRTPDEIAVRLRDPGGTLLHPDLSEVRRIVGDGYVAFELHDPAPGKWFLEVETARETHVAYTASGFVRSRLRLDLALDQPVVGVGEPLRLRVRVGAGDAPVRFTARAQAVTPAQGVPTLLKQYHDQLREQPSPPALTADGVPDDIARLSALRDALLAQGRPDLFATRTQRIPVTAGAATFTATGEPGSYNLTVTASGVDPVGHTRFVRTQLVTALVR